MCMTIKMKFDVWSPWDLPHALVVVVAENHYPLSNLSINLGPVALLRIEGRLKGTGVKNRSLFEIARSAESYDGKS